MLAVAGRPFLEHLICYAARFGIRKFLLLAGYMGEAIEKHFANGVFRTPGATVEVKVVIESEALGTAGALRLVSGELAAEFLLINGDSLFNFNWLDLCSPLSESTFGRIALRSVPAAARYGVVSIDAGGLICGMKERPDQVGPGLINGGVYWLSRRILDFVDDYGPVSLERTVFPRLIEGRLLEASTYQGAFIDIGVPEDYALAQQKLATRRRAVFFDRDGVLNVDKGYVHQASQLEWCNGAVEAIRYLNERDVLAFVVTNQAGVARGYYAEADVRRFHDHLQYHLNAAGAHIDDFRYCPHHPDAIVESYRLICDWRKPGKGMLADICAHWPVDIHRSVMLGDKDTDIEASTAMGIRGIKAPGSDNLYDIVRRWVENERS